MQPYAVVQIKGHQYKVSQGDKVLVDKLDALSGESITLDQVKLVVKSDQELLIGDPHVSSARVEAVIDEHVRHPKVIVFKKKRRKDYKRKRGHKQLATAITVTAVHAS